MASSPRASPQLCRPTWRHNEFRGQWSSPEVQHTRHLGVEGIWPGASGRLPIRHGAETFELTATGGREDIGLPVCVPKEAQVPDPLTTSVTIEDTIRSATQPFPTERCPTGRASRHAHALPALRITLLVTTVTMLSLVPSARSPEPRGTRPSLAGLWAAKLRFGPASATG